MDDRLYRSRDDRVIAGVAGGIAERFNLDPSLVRIVWALLVFLTGGVALVLYIVMAIVVPEEDDLFRAGRPPTAPPPDPFVGGHPMTQAEWRAQRRTTKESRRRERGPLSGGVIVGVILIVVGVWYLLREYVPALDPGRFWPFAIVALGVVLLLFAFRRGSNDAVGPDR